MLRLTASGLVEPVMFQFGTLEQRDACVDAINQLGSVVRGQGGVGSAGPGAASLANDSDAELKVRLLASTPGLAELHRNLVRSGGLTEAEFWSGAERKMLLEKEHYKQKAQVSEHKNIVMSTLCIIIYSLPHIKRKRTQLLYFSFASSQARGLSSTFHEQILTRSSNLRITPQMVTQILVERPAVQRALLTFVSGHLQGDDLKKKHHEFWKLYVKYCKVRLNNGPLDDDLQLFRQCEEDEDRSMRERDRVRAKEVDPTVDLIADRFDGFGIGYGLAPDNRRSDVNLSDAKNSRAIIRELNRHATAAVEGLPDSLRENAAAMADENWMDRTQAFADQLQRHEKQRSEQEAHPNYSRPLARRPDGLVLDDLLEDKEHERRLIPVNDVRKYFTGDENMPSTSMPSSSLSRNDCWSLAAAIDGVQRSNGSAAVIGCPAISESLATQALEEMARFEDDPATAQGALTFLRENVSHIL